MDIPDHLWIELLTYLEPKELCIISLVNKYFYTLSATDYLWKIIMVSKFNKVPKLIENCKRSFAEINFMATRIINQYQSETHNLEIVLERERKRQREVLEYKRIERRLSRALKG